MLNNNMSETWHSMKTQNISCDNQVQENNVKDKTN